MTEYDRSQWPSCDGVAASASTRTVPQCGRGSNGKVASLSCSRNRERDTGRVITEHALLPVIPGREDDFERAFAEARAIIMSMPGCRSLSLSRSIESPSNYLLLVEWEHLDDHTIGFRQSEEYQRWRTLLHHFYDPFPLVEHYQAVQ